MRKRFIWLLFMVVALLLFGWYFLRDIQLSELKLVSSSTVLYIILLTLLNIYGNVLAVSVLLSGMGYRMPIRSIYLIVTGAGTASYVSNVKLGIPARIFLYNKVLGIPASRGTASMAVETAMWIAAMALIVLIPSQDLASSEAWWLALVVVLALVLAYVCAINLPDLGYRLKDKEGRFVGRLRSIWSFVARMQEGIRAITKTSLVAILVLLVLLYLIDAFSIRLILKDLGYDIGLFSLMRIIVISYLVGLFSIMPLGLGAREASLTFLLVQLGVPKEIALSCALIQRTVRLVIPLTLGLISANILGINFWKRSDPGEGTNDNQTSHSSIVS